MTKEELVSQIAKETGVTIKDTNMMVDAVARAIADEMVRGGKIVIPHLGTFYTSISSSGNGLKLGDNPNGCEYMRVIFRAGSEIKKRLKGSD